MQVFENIHSNAEKVSAESEVLILHTRFQHKMYLLKTSEEKAYKKSKYLKKIYY